MISVWFDFVEEDRESMRRYVRCVPRIGEMVDVIPVEGEGKTFYLQRVGDVRHYVEKAELGHEIRVLLERRGR